MSRVCVIEVTCDIEQNNVGHAEIDGNENMYVDEITLKFTSLIIAFTEL